MANINYFNAYIIALPVNQVQNKALFHIIYLIIHGI
jgi:hypothetical protein